MGNDDSKSVFLISAASTVEADMIEAMLNDNGILCFKKGYNSTLQILGGSMAGIDFYVSEDDLEAANELAEVLFSGDFDEEEAGEYWNVGEDEGSGGANETEDAGSSLT